MARDSRNRAGSADSDTDSVSADPQPSGGGVVTLDVEDNKLVNRETGEEVAVVNEPDALLPDWLWAQHNAAPQE